MKKSVLFLLSTVILSVSILPVYADEIDNAKSLVKEKRWCVLARKAFRGVNMSEDQKTEIKGIVADFRDDIIAMLPAILSKHNALLEEMLTYDNELKELEIISLYKDYADENTKRILRRAELWNDIQGALSLPQYRRAVVGRLALGNCLRAKRRVYLRYFYNSI